MSTHTKTTSTQMVRKISVALLKIVVTPVLIVLLAIFATSVSPIYDFGEARPFGGPDIFNPYQSLADSAYGWKRANFHTHTRVNGILNECEYGPAEIDEGYRKLGYDIVTFSNHNQLTEYPRDPSLRVNVYEHGVNLFKYHKLVFGSDRVDRFDHLVPLLASQRQFQLDRLGKGSDLIQMNHPLRTTGTSKKLMQKLGGYRIMELDSGKSTENEYWDWALSAGHYSFGLAGDDLHHPDRAGAMAVRSNLMNTPSARYEDIRRTLLAGAYYSMRTPGTGPWGAPAAGGDRPAITAIGLEGATIHIWLSHRADSIKVTGQNHTTLSRVTDAAEARYTMSPDDSYARITAWFPGGEAIYTNPFARYDSSVADTPYTAPSHGVNIPLTILFNLAILALCAGVVVAFHKTVIRRW